MHIHTICSITHYYVRTYFKRFRDYHQGSFTIVVRKQQKQNCEVEPLNFIVDSIIITVDVSNLVVLCEKLVLNFTRVI